ncbi:MAG: toll/interleukin-1 receptor domain-containing protein [Synergistaceae bacterium]|nr:toll/interleukin-1 receptor domain-containing protein [Synergistaceae bacterium]
MAKDLTACGTTPCDLDGGSSFIFVSYAHKDARFVFPVIDGINANGYKVWYDGGIRISASWTDEIAKAVQTCAVFLTFISKNAMESDFVRREIEFALTIPKKTIIPVYLDGMDVLPSGLALMLSTTQGITNEKYPVEVVSRILKALENNGIAREGEIDSGWREKLTSRLKKYRKKSLLLKLAVAAPVIAAILVAGYLRLFPAKPAPLELQASLINVSVQSDRPSDELLLSKLTALFEDGTLPDYNLVASSLDSRVHLQVARPSAEAAPQVWVMDPKDGSLFNRQESLKIPLDDDSVENGSLDVLRGNLTRLAALRALQDMPSIPFRQLDLLVEYRIFAKVSDEEWLTLPEWERKSIAGQRWKLTRTISADEDGDVKLDPEERLLEIRAANHSSRSFHIYAVNATPDASILPFLPYSNLRSTEVKPRETLTFDEDGILLEEKWEYIRIIASESALDIQGLYQEGFVTYPDRSATRGSIPQAYDILNENEPAGMGRFFLLD